MNDTVIRQVSEHNHRRFYRRWAELMAAERWSDLRAPTNEVGEHE